VIPCTRTTVAIAVTVAPRDHDPAQFAADAGALDDRLGFGPRVLLGHPYGWCAALEMAARSPQRLSGLKRVEPAAVRMYSYRKPVIPAARGQGAWQEMFAAPRETGTQTRRRMSSIAEGRGPLHWD